MLPLYNLLKRFIFMLLLALQFSAFSQDKGNDERQPEERENSQEQREEWFLKSRYDSAIQNPESARWKAYASTTQKLAQVQSVPVANWQSLGPTNQGGRMLSYAFDPFNSQVLWAGSSTGGLWRTTNGGTSWQAMTDNLPSLSVGAVAINPKNSNVMLMGTGEGYLLSSWFKYGVGVLKSTDGGTTWLPTGLAMPDSLKFASLGFAWNPDSTNYVYLATTYGVFVSQDEGDNWSLNLPGIATSVVINKKNPDIVYASLQHNSPGSTGGIYRSSNKGLSWMPLTTGTPAASAIGFTTLSICDSFPNVLYAGIAKPMQSASVGQLQGLYKTSDGGNSWVLLPSSVDFYCYPPPFSSTCQGWYGNVTAVSPIDTNKVFAGGVYLYKSVNGGNTWAYSDYAPLENPAYMHPDYHSLAFQPGNPQVMYAFQDGGIFKTTNGASSWYNKNNGLVTGQFYYAVSSMTNPQLIMGGMQDNGVKYNANTTTTTDWYEYAVGDGFTCLIDYTNASVMYATEFFKGRMRSTDGGITYDTINTGITGNAAFIIPLVMHPVNNSVLYTATMAKVYTSSDSGSHWTPLVNYANIMNIAFDKINPSYMYMCTDPYYSTSSLYLSANGGGSWNPIASPNNKITDIEADPNVQGTLYATCAKYTAGQQVWKSTNYGSSWTNISGSFPGIPANTITINPNNTNHLYVGTDLGVYLSIDGGLTWNPYNDNLANVIVMDSHYYPSDSTIRVGTHGRGIWKTTAVNPFFTSIKEEHHADDVSVNIFPNPTTGAATIHYTLTEPGQVSIKVINTLGQQVRELVNTKQKPGVYKLEWDGKNTVGQKPAEGIYFIRISLQDKSMTVKLILSE